VCKFCGYSVQPGYPGDVHVDCAKDRIKELEGALLELLDAFNPEPRMDHPDTIWGRAALALAKSNT
jgi:hypothetical protein